MRCIYAFWLYALCEPRRSFKGAVSFEDSDRTQADACADNASTARRFQGANFDRLIPRDRDAL